MSESELAGARALLGVDGGITREALQRRFLQRSYALIRSGAPDEERVRLKAAHDVLAAQLDAAPTPAPVPMRVPVLMPAVTSLTAAGLGAVGAEEATLRAALGAAEADAEEEDRPDRPFDPVSFESPWVRALAPPLVAAAAVLVQKSFLGFFLTGLHVWVHELGHATVAWMRGLPAAPLPFGLTFVGEERSNIVYGIGLILFGLLVTSGVKERKFTAVVLGVALATVQAWAMWRLPPDEGRMWLAFGGVGGELILATTMMGLFYCEFPGRFRWGGCRYVFLFIGAGRFFETYGFWKRVKRGDEGIPYGSMVNGEEDGGGDMNVLHNEYGWTQHRIIHTYNDLADACLLALVLLYVFFALRLDLLAVRLWRCVRGAG